MADNKYSILSTRVLSQELIEKAAENGLVIQSFAFIDRKPILTAELEEKMMRLSESSFNVAFTSQYAVEIVIGLLAGRVPPWKIFTTGPITSGIVERYFGASSIAATAESAEALADLIIDFGNISEIQFFCGRQRRNSLPDRLKLRGIRVAELAVYDTTTSSQKISARYDGICFFSPSAVHSFFAEHKASDGTQLFAIGKTTASAITDYWNGSVVLSLSPDKEQLIQQVIDYFHNNPIRLSGDIRG